MKLEIFDRQYSDYHWIDEDGRKINSPCPIKRKLFDGDKYSSGIIKLSSKYRSEQMSGVLHLTGNTHGRHKGNMLYICYPNDRCLPAFLVPYKNKKLAFSKHKVDVYVQFEFIEWNNNHPLGRLTNTIGVVSDMNAYAEYQLICNDLNQSIQKLTKKISVSIQQSETDISYTEYKLEDRTSKEWNIFTIDPEGCLDADDAMSLKTLANNRYLISTYISAVPLVIDKLKLWDEINKDLERVSTIYFPNKRLPMIPKKLSEGLCSLLSGCKRPALAMDLLVDDGKIIDVNFVPVLVLVSKNYVYESSQLLCDKDYHRIKDLLILTNNDNKYKKSIKDSHDVVEYLMLMMNHQSGIKLLLKNGIFRKFKGSDKDVGNIDEDLGKFLKTWGSDGGEYTIETADVSHDMMPEIVNVYAQVTSPIRRIVDLVNICLLLKEKGVYFSGDVFIEKWRERIDLINTRMKSIRRVQNEVRLISLCQESKDSGNMQEYTGYIIETEMCDRIEKQINYTVFIKDIGCVSKFRSEKSYLLYKQMKFTIHLFTEKDSLKKKVRVYPRD